MASTLRRCVSLGSSGVGSPGSNQDYAKNAEFFKETGSRWARLWAEWFQLQPESDYPPDEGSGAFRVMSRTGFDGHRVSWFPLFQERVLRAAHLAA